MVIVDVLGDGTSLRVDQKGTVHLPTATVCPGMILIEVVHVRLYNINLFSVANVSSYGTKCTYLEKNGGGHIE